MNGGGPSARPCVASRAWLVLTTVPEPLAGGHTHRPCLFVEKLVLECVRTHRSAGRRAVPTRGRRGAKRVNPRDTPSYGVVGGNSPLVKVKPSSGATYRVSPPPPRMARGSSRPGVRSDARVSCAFSRTRVSRGSMRGRPLEDLGSHLTSSAPYRCVC